MLVAKFKKHISGLTLIEVLIGIVISTIIMGAMYTTYTVVNQSYSQVTNKAKISRSGRDIIEMLIRDIRLAGFKYVVGTNNSFENGDQVPQRTYLNFITGGAVHLSHDPISIIKDKGPTESALGYAKGRTENGMADYAPADIKRHNEGEDTCCDRIHIVYDDFNQWDEDEQYYKRYRVTYYALPETGGTTENPDNYYSIYKTLELWQQEQVPAGDDPDNGEWTGDVDLCAECYVEQKIRDHVVDMEFMAFDKDGKIIPTVRSDVDAAKIYEIRSIDLRITFRSKSNFFRLKAKKLIQGLGGTRGKAFKDRYLRDSVIVTVFTRNIGT